MLGNTGISRMVRNTLSWKSLLSLIVWERGKSHLQNQSIIWKDHISG